jgi:L-2-hydroxyglutarate oxidase LhgO
MQILVIGAGVIGLAVARAGALAGHEVIVAEQDRGIGTGISSRNSEVIHAGMYYPTGSVRGRHCTHGRRLLYAYCESHRVRHRKCGKLIVATNAAEAAQLAVIERQGGANEVEGLAMIDGEAARRLEPAVACIAALHSSETGIIDGHGFMLALQGDLEDHGGMIAFGTRVVGLRPLASRWSAGFEGLDAGEIAVDAVVNAAGLGAQAMAAATEGYPASRIPPLMLCKGNYFTYAGRPAFSRLIYPVPVDGGLGIHVTIDLTGRMRFGPDVEWIDRECYDVDKGRAELFYARIKSYWPAVRREALVPDYSGIRPKLTGPGEKPADFMIEGPAQHGLPQLVHLFGIESPGLTTALSLAEEVVAQLT